MSRSIFFIWLGALVFLSFNALSQGLISPTADADQAEQLFLSQTLEWGYGRQPPLYTWITHSLFSLTGPDLWALRAIKVANLGIFVLAMLGIGKELSFTKNEQLLLVMSLALIPQFLWESQRDLTNSPMAAMFAALTLWCVLVIRRDPQLKYFTFLGVTVACGLLSKFNVAIFLAALGFATLVVRDFRRQLFTLKVLVTLTTALVILLFPGIWIIEHFGEASGSAEKLRTGAPFTLAGLTELLSAVLAFAGPLLLAFCLSFQRRVTSAPTAPSDQRFLVLTFFASLVLLALVVLVSGATQVKDRWMQPILFVVPVLLVIFGIGRQRMFFFIATLVLLTAAVMLPARTPLAAFNEKLVSRPNLPYSVLASSLKADVGSPGLILTDSRLLAGNLRLHFPQSRLVVVSSADDLKNFLNSVHPPAGGLIFLTDHSKFDKPESPWARYEKLFPGQAPREVNAPLFFVPTQTHSLFYLKLFN